ncbi:MAG: glycosyltransferase family 39 protein [Bacteroidota bacterium]
MLKLLSYNHLVTYALLFVFTVALRLPSFHTNFYEQDEAYYLVAAEKIVDGGVQYVDTWDNKPPILTWFYALFVAVFGSYAIVAIRIFTCLYLYVSALLFNQFVTDNKLLSRFSLLPGFLLVFLCSIPWYAQELNGEILMNLPIILAVFRFLRLQERSSRNNTHLFVAGILLGIAFMIKYQAIVLFLGMFGAYLTIFTPRLSETFSLFSGFAMAIFVALAGIYFSGAFEAYWDIGVLYNLDYIFLGKNPGESVSLLFNLGQYGQLWGIFILLGLIGVVNFRLNYFTNAIRLRKIEMLVLFWLGTALLTIVLGGSRLYLHYFYLLVPPLCMYVARFFEMRLRPWVRNLALLAALLVPAFTYGVYFASVFPKTFSFLDEDLRPGGWISGFRQRLNEPHPLAQYIDPEKVHNGILVMDYEPSIYARLDLPCATKYTNFSIAYYKLAPFQTQTEESLISRTETDADIYRAFRDELPEYIIDPLDLFPLLRQRLPLLFAAYRGRLVSECNRSYRLYSRVDQ